jgi:hypothetical protein
MYIAGIAMKITRMYDTANGKRVVRVFMARSSGSQNTQPVQVDHDRDHEEECRARAHDLLCLGPVPGADVLPDEHRRRHRQSEGAPQQQEQDRV